VVFEHVINAAIPRRHRPQGRARTRPGRLPLGGGADELVDERLRKAAALHRTRQQIADFNLYLGAALITIRQLIQRTRNRYRWDTRPETKRLK